MPTDHKTKPCSVKGCQGTMTFFDPKGAIYSGDKEGQLIGKQQFGPGWYCNSRKHFEPEKPEALMTDDGEVGGLGEDERRRFPRMQANCVVEISLSQDHRRQSYNGRLTELSLGGGLLELDVTYAVESRLTLRFWLSDQSDVLCTGIVRCLRDGQGDWQGHGLEFADLSSHDLARLRKSLEAI